MPALLPSVADKRETPEAAPSSPSGSIFGQFQNQTQPHGLNIPPPPPKGEERETRWGSLKGFESFFLRGLPPSLGAQRCTSGNNRSVPTPTALPHSLDPEGPPPPLDQPNWTPEGRKKPKAGCGGGGSRPRRGPSAAHTAAGGDLGVRPPVRPSTPSSSSSSSGLAGTRRDASRRRGQAERTKEAARERPGGGGGCCYRGVSGEGAAPELPRRRGKEEQIGRGVPASGGGSSESLPGSVPLQPQFGAGSGSWAPAALSSPPSPPSPTRSRAGGGGDAAGESGQPPSPSRRPPAGVRPYLAAAWRSGAAGDAKGEGSPAPLGGPRRSDGVSCSRQRGSRSRGPAWSRDRGVQVSSAEAVVKLHENLPRFL
ncbi:uncharacterized protein LOC143822030 [Paroedura picta]|uniref:uncharacterized protein LOC143822030 n=1 Tax=Paroedura picta TaxID=143630 RepID=UPI004055CBBC